ncbi:hypothetical protein QQS21_011981 [Conoideocrella luteorostrata]|uniref:Xylanolytic transcriptional activator regulatory domain-containing protein n=1 Tax=Conoideocrella luteorostrata TaxID=1105319 RepID=A0AAJ0FT55_9HYPO|nr:hypothetical protein QQS21_011981 [Conoideocrella luteorostrata]
MLSKQTAAPSASAQAPDTQFVHLDDLAIVAAQSRPQTKSPAPSPDQSPEQCPGQSPPESSPEPSPDSIHEIPPPLPRSNCGMPLFATANNTLDIDADSFRSYLNGTPALLGLADNDEHMSQPDSYVRPPEEGQDSGLDLNQDNLDAQDFVLGWSHFQPVLDEMPIFTLQPGLIPDDLCKAGGSRSIEIRYYRTFGPTALFPGRRRLSLRIEHGDDRSETIGSTGQTLNGSSAPGSRNCQSTSLSSNSSTNTGLFDSANQQPHPDIIYQILDDFFDRLGGHIPFLSHDILLTHIGSNVASSFLLNAIAAVTLRFCSNTGALAEILGQYKGERSNPSRHCAAFIAKARAQLVGLLSVPEPEVVGGLILLAWADFGEKNETGLWMFAGMAIRMAQDLGFDRTTETDIDLNLNLHDHAWPSPDGTYSLTHEDSLVHQQEARLALFWSTFNLDVCVSLATGRPPTLNRDDIQVALPSFEDMMLAQLDFSKETTQKNMIFPTLVKFMYHFSEAVALLNRASSAKSLDPLHAAGNSGPDAFLARRAQLIQLRESLVMHYNNLPAELVFSMANFNMSANSSQDGIFLQMHAFFFMIIALLSNEASDNVRQDAPSCTACSDTTPMPKLTKSELDSNIALGACQKLIQIFTTASVVNKMSYLTSPFTYHCLFVAASTTLDAQSTAASPFPASAKKPSATFFTLTAGCDYQFLRQTLKEQSTYFAGIATAINLLAQKEKQLMRGDPVDDGLEDGSNEPELDRVALLNDAGLINRYCIRDQGA